MKNAMLGFAAACVLLFPLSAHALRTAPCRLRLTGRFVSPDYSRDMEVAVRLTVRAISESLWLEGRMRCTSVAFDCFLSDGEFGVRLEPHDDGNHVGLRTSGFLLNRRNVSADVCELRAVTGQFRPNHCFGAIIGTFECPPEGGVPLRGNFGWTVDTCRCLGR